MLYTNPRRVSIVPSYVEAHWLNRERTIIVGWRLIVVFRLHRIPLWCHRIGYLVWLQLHSISLAITSLGAWFDRRRPTYKFVSRDSIVLLGWLVPTQLELWHWWELSEYCQWWNMKSLVPLSPTLSPPVRISRLGFAMITNIHSPTWMCLAPNIIAIVGQTPTIFDGSFGNPTKRVSLILLHWGTLHN